MDKFTDALQAIGFRGDVDESASTRDYYSHDASMFEIQPKIVVFPKDSADVEKLVQVSAGLKKSMPNLSLTARSAGTDMSGGAINDSVIVDFTKYFSKIGTVTASSARTQPGVYYRDFEKATLKRGALMPSFPASRELCTVGGMVSNNSGGEKSLEFGKTERYVTELDVVLADGKSYTLKPLGAAELTKKMKLKTFEGEVYRNLHKLLSDHYDQIKAAKPNVSKNSTGYNLWNIWDKETGVFDMTQLIIGAQGTLGFVTSIRFRLVKNKQFSGVLVAFLKNTNRLGEIIVEVMKHKPATFESFDNYTLWLSIKFFFSFRKTIGWGNLIKLGLQLIPDALLLLKGIPKLIMLIEFTGDSQDEVDQKIRDMHHALKRFKISAMEEDNTPAKAWKFRIMRRESFNLLRKKVKDKHTAPFIDDFVVPPEHLAEFLPKLRTIINKYKLMATVAGHMGDGNFHVIPLMRLEDKKERAKLQPAMREVNELVLSYKGSLSGEHNDGLVRGPWLEAMYGKPVLKLFKDTKHIFDPHNMFNPHKKATSDWKYTFDHVRDHF